MSIPIPFTLEKANEWLDMSNEKMVEFFKLHMSLTHPGMAQKYLEGARANTIILGANRVSDAATVPVDYYIKIGKFFTEDSYLTTYLLTEHEPASVHAPRSGEKAINIRSEVIQKCASNACTEHQSQILITREWKCVSCSKPATTIRFLCIVNSKNMEQAGRPANFCNGSPVCNTDPNSHCQAVANIMLHKKMLVDFSYKVAAEEDRYCENCGLGKDINFCPCGCVGYCSKECQRAGWYEHKTFCKAYALKEKKKETADGGMAKKENTEVETKKCFVIVTFEDKDGGGNGDGDGDGEDEKNDSTATRAELD